MELVIATDRWNGTGGGRERYLADLTRFLASRGDSVRVYCHEATVAPSSPQVELEVVGGIGCFRPLRLHRALSRCQIRPVLAACPTTSATHYQLHAGLYEDAFAAERESLESGVRRALFWPATTMNARRAWLLAEERRLLAQADSTNLMVFNEELGEALVAQRGVARSRIRVARPGVDLARFQPAAPNDPAVSRAPREGDLRLLFVGHNYVLKGLFWILAALTRLERLGLRASLVVAGRGPIGRFRRLARRLGIESRVTFRGDVDQAELAALYRTADALVHPTFYDPFPRIIVEALSSGCPVITTRRCGGASLIRPGVNGDLIDDPRDTETLVSAIGALTDSVRLARMRDAAVAGRTHSAFETHAAEVVEWLRA